MPRHKKYLLSILSCLFLASLGYAAQPGDWDDPSWQLLREAHIHRDAHSLATYLRDLCGADADLARVDALIHQLGSPDFDKREQASKALIAVGPAALAALSKARNDSDAEVARRAKACLARIGGEWRPELVQAAVRVLIRRGGGEAVPTLLRFLPHADFTELQDDIWFGLDALTVRQGKIDPSLTEALHDPMAIRRAAAACIVGRRGDADQRAAVRKLLADADAEVRLRAAQGLLAAKDASGVPALAALLEGTPMETAWQAEELLRYVAGEEAPHTILGAGAADDRRTCREAWEAWRKERWPKVDLAKLDATRRRPGLMLLCDGGLPEEATGRVWLLGCDGVTRWDLRKLSNPSDARLMAGGRVLVEERALTPHVQIPLALPPQKKSDDAGVSLRNLDGNILWRYQGVNGPMQCEVMPDGRVLIVGRKLQIAEVDTAGNETFRKDFSTSAFPMELEYYMIPQSSLSPFELKPDTRIVVRRPSDKSQAIEWVEVSPRWSSAYGLKRGRPPGWFSFYWLCPDFFKRVLDADDDIRIWPLNSSRVERIRTNTQVSRAGSNWTLWMPGVFCAAALPNGDILAGGIGRVVELDAKGRPLRSSSIANLAQRVHPCFNRVRLGFDAPRAHFDLTANPDDWLSGLHSKTAAVRRHCVDAIRQFDLQTVEAASPSLKPLLMDPDEAVRDATRRTLGRLSSDVPVAWLRAMRDKNPKVRKDARQFLTEPYSPSKVIETLIAMLKDRDPALRAQGASWLGMESNPSFTEKIVPALIATFRDEPDPKVRWVAAFSLGRFGVKARDAIPALLEGLKDPDANVHHQSELALAAIDPFDGPAYAALIEAAQAKETDWGAVEALINSGQYKEVVPILVKFLEAKDFNGKPEAKENLRKGIITELGRIGPDAKAAVPVLAAILRDRSAGVSIRALSLREAAARALGQIGPAAQAAIPDLENAKNEGGPGIEANLRREAADALVKIQED